MVNSRSPLLAKLTLSSISALIPSDVVSTISSHLRRPAESYPVVFDVPSSHQLNRLMPTPLTTALESNPPKTPQIPPPPTVASLITPPSTPQTSSTPSLAKSLRLSSLFWVHPTVRRAFMSGEEPQALPKKRPRPVSLIVPSRGSTDTTILQRPKATRNSYSPSLVEGQTTLEVRRYVHRLLCWEEMR